MTHSFGDLEGTTRRARARAEWRMRTTVAVQYQVGTTIDPETDADIPAYETAYETKARIRARAQNPNRADAGGRTAVESERELHIPVSSPDPWDDPRAANGVSALVLAVDATGDPTLLGKRLHLLGPMQGDQQSARRLQVTEVVA